MSGLEANFWRPGTDNDFGSEYIIPECIGWKDVVSQVKLVNFNVERPRKICGNSNKLRIRKNEYDLPIVLSFEWGGRNGDTLSRGCSILYFRIDTSYRIDVAACT